MANDLLNKNYDAGRNIAKYRIVKWDDEDAEVAQAAGPEDTPIGVVDRNGGTSGGRVEVMRIGIAPVEYGGAVTRGDRLTSDADGKAVKAEPSLYSAVVDGAADNVDIAVAGIETTDELAAVVNLSDNDTPAGAEIHSDGNIRSTDPTNGDKLLVLWRRPVGVIGTAEVTGVAGDVGEVLIAPSRL